jgi:AcrR family transcriptional regulator
MDGKTLTRVRAPEQTRERLLQAAIRVINMRGAAGLTLDAVAAESGVSKGGLLHHFPNKDALVRGLVDLLVSRFDQRMALLYEKDADTGPGRWLRAYVRGTFASTHDDDVLVPAMGVLAAGSPELLSALHRELENARQCALNDGLPAGRAIAIQLACDGMWLSELVGVKSLDDDARNALRDELIALTYL